MPNLSTLARLGHTLEIHVWWCTQKPTMSGSSAGIDPQIAACCDVRVGLSVATPTEAQTVDGVPGWPADRLPKRGWFLEMLPDGSRGATQARSWFVSDEQIRSFPPRAPWSRSSLHEGPTPPLTPPPGGRPALTLVKPLAADPSAPVPLPRQETEARDDTDTVLLAELRAGGPRTQTGLARASGVAKATTARALARLVKAGKVTEVDGGPYAAADDEASSC